MGTWKDGIGQCHDLYFVTLCYAGVQSFIYIRDTLGSTIYHGNESVPERFCWVGWRRDLTLVQLCGKLSSLVQTSKVYMLHLTLSKMPY